MMNLVTLGQRNPSRYKIAEEGRTQINLKISKHFELTEIGI